MNCPECGGEMGAVSSGPPTIWQCNRCSEDEVFAVRYEGDTPGNLSRC